MARPGRARRPGIAAALTVAVISSIAPSSRAGSAGEPGPGSMVWVGEVGAVAPAPGTTVWVEALGAAGSSPVVGIETLANGTVVIHRPGTGSGAEAAAGGGLLAPCSDPAFTALAHAVPSQLAWSFRTSTTPANLTVRKARGALRRAAANIARGDNDCDIRDAVAAGQRYLGATTTGPNITRLSACRARDGSSVVGFGDLAAGHLALACWWTQGDDVVEGDIRLNDVEYDWVVFVGATCRNRWSVEAVATHEFGHLFGLDHVDEEVHGNLTMSPLIDPCQDQEKTLGAGDVAGFSAKYPGGPKG